MGARAYSCTLSLPLGSHGTIERSGELALAGGTPFTPTCPDSGSVWCRQFGYDNGGNRSIAARTPSGANLWDAGTFNSNNRIADPNWSYDNNGNVIKAPVPQTIGYDAENRQGAVCTQDPTGCPSQYASGRTVYVYDGLGNRVQRIDNTGTSMFVYDAFGNLAAEYGTTAAAPGTQYVTVDALGSTRLYHTRRGWRRLGLGWREHHNRRPGWEICMQVGPMPAPINRVIWKRIRSGLAVACVSVFVGYFCLWNVYYDTLPAAPDKKPGRVYPDNFHGRVLYQSCAERFHLSLLSYAGEGLALLLVSAELFERQRLTK